MSLVFISATVNDMIAPWGRGVMKNWSTNLHQSVDDSKPIFKPLLNIWRSDARDGSQSRWMAM